VLWRAMTLLTQHVATFSLWSAAPLRITAADACQSVAVLKLTGSRLFPSRIGHHGPPQIAAVQSPAPSGHRWPTSRAQPVQSSPPARAASHSVSTSSATCSPILHRGGDPAAPTALPPRRHLLHRSHASQHPTGRPPRAPRHGSQCFSEIEIGGCRGSTAASPVRVPIRGTRGSADRDDRGEQTWRPGVHVPSHAGCIQPSRRTDTRPPDSLGYDSMQPYLADQSNSSSQDLDSILKELATWIPAHGPIIASRACENLDF